MRPGSASAEGFSARKAVRQRLRRRGRRATGDSDAGVALVLEYLRVSTRRGALARDVGNARWLRAHATADGRDNAGEKQCHEYCERS